MDYAPSSTSFASLVHSFALRNQDSASSRLDAFCACRRHSSASLRKRSASITVMARTYTEPNEDMRRPHLFRRHDQASGSSARPAATKQVPVSVPCHPFGAARWPIRFAVRVDVRATRTAGGGSASYRKTAQSAGTRSLERGRKSGTCALDVPHGIVEMTPRVTSPGSRMRSLDMITPEKVSAPLRVRKVRKADAFARRLSQPWSTRSPSATTASPAG